MALWHVLILVCFAVPFGASLAAAQETRVGVGGYILAGIVGSAVGGCFGWTMWKTHRVISDKVQRGLLLKGCQAQREWFFGALYFAELVWAAVAGAVAFWLSLTLLQAVS